MSRGKKGWKTRATLHVTTSEKKGIEDKERLGKEYDAAKSLKEDRP